jgi:hypothetical protein
LIVGWLGCEGKCGWRLGVAGWKLQVARCRLQVAVRCVNGYEGEAGAKVRRSCRLLVVGCWLRGFGSFRSGRVVDFAGEAGRGDVYAD